MDPGTLYADEHAEVDRGPGSLEVHGGRALEAPAVLARLSDQLQQLLLVPLGLVGARLVVGDCDALLLHRGCLVGTALRNRHLVEAGSHAPPRLPRRSSGSLRVHDACAVVHG
eukprot:4514169-Prymnesium_polylepis.1